MQAPVESSRSSAREPDPDPGQRRLPAEEPLHNPAQADPEAGVVQGPADGVVLLAGQPARGVHRQVTGYPEPIGPHKLFSMISIGETIMPEQKATCQTRKRYKTDVTDDQWALVDRSSAPGFEDIFLWPLTLRRSSMCAFCLQAQQPEGFRLPGFPREPLGLTKAGPDNMPVPC